jgi:hypothetical protein
LIVVAVTPVPSVVVGVKVLVLGVVEVAPPEPLFDPLLPQAARIVAAITKIATYRNRLPAIAPSQVTTRGAS